jgi:hypothetical protein
MSQQLDPIDTIATKAFEGYVVRKDLVRKFKGQYPVPTYVAEFLLGRYCASVDEDEIAEGLKIVERQLGRKDHPRRRARAVQGPRQGKGACQADRHHHRPTGCRLRFLRGHACRACS